MKSVPDFRAFLVLLSLSVFPNLSFAEVAAHCPTVLLDESDPDVATIPITDQGFNGSCYVHGSSFLAQIWMRRNWKNARAYTIQDPELIYDMLDSEPKDVLDKILDAENGRTCMSLDWNLKLSAAGNPKLSIPKCNMFGFLKNDRGQILRPESEIKAKMKTLLAKKKPMPFAIEYCSGVLRGAKDLIKNRQFHATLTYLNTMDRYENLSATCGFHVSVVVGQMWRDGQCQIRVRNSWGVTAQGSEFGYFWVPEDDLAASTLRVVFMSRR